MKTWLAVLIVRIGQLIRRLRRLHPPLRGVGHRSRARFAALWISVLAACPTASQPPTGPPPDGRGYPGLLRAPSAVPGDYLLRQRVTAQWGDGERRGFDAALQKRGDTLTMLGLTPMGTKAFVVTQQGEDVTLDNLSDQPLPFPPRYIMLDVQRVLFPWLPPATARSDGVASGEVAGERVSERYAAGVLAERCFERLDGAPPGRICVAYAGWAPDAIAPARAILDNGWYGYRLEVETVSQQALPTAPEKSGGDAPIP